MTTKIMLEHIQANERAGNHTEYIHCPHCEDIQEATVIHTLPYPSYVHFCTTCTYAITESEWEQATEQEVESYKVQEKAVKEAYDKAKAPAEKTSQYRRRPAHQLTEES